MKKKSKVYIVHCIDTEGPLDESVIATFERLKNIFGFDLKPTKKNLRLIQNKKINFQGKEELISETFSKDLLNYNNNWKKIITINKELISKKFRNTYKDTNQKGWIYNWFIMDHVGYKNNPRKKDLGFHKIWNKYESLYKRNKKVDGFYFHHHPQSLTKSATSCGTHYFIPEPTIFEVLNRKIIDKCWFPSVYRPGFHTIRPDSNWFLEQFIPFDYSNQNIKEKKQKIKTDLSNGRFGDWRRAPNKWFPYHPSHDDYQIPGNSRRWSTRCLNLGTRHRLLKAEDVMQAFKQADSGSSAILAFTNHDFRDIRKDIDHVYSLIVNASKKFPKIKFEWCEARDAMRLCLNLKKPVRPIIKQKIINNKFYLNFSSKIFGPQPYLVFKTKNDDYFHDNFDIQKPFNSWTYTFDEYNVDIKNIKKIGWAANNSYGNTYVSVFSPTKPIFDVKVI